MPAKKIKSSKKKAMTSKSATSKKSPAKKKSTSSKTTKKKTAKKKTVSKKKPAMKKAVSKKPTAVKKVVKHIEETPSVEEQPLMQTTQAFDLNDLPSLVEPEPPVEELSLEVVAAGIGSRLSFYMGVFFGAIVLHALVVSVLVLMTV